MARRSGSMSAGGLPQSTRVPACLSPTEPEYALPVQAETSPERQMQSVRVNRLCAGNKHTCATGGRVEGRWPCPLKRDVASGPADIAALCSPRHCAEGDQLCVAGLQISTCTCTDAPATAKAVSLCEQVRRGEQAHMRNGAGPARREPTSASSTAPEAPVASLPCAFGGNPPQRWF